MDLSQSCGLMVHLPFTCLLLVLTNQLGLFASSIIRDTTSRISYWFSFKGINQSSDPEILVCQKMPHFDLNQDWSLSLNHYWRRKVKSSMIDFQISGFFAIMPNQEFMRFSGFVRQSVKNSMKYLEIWEEFRKRKKSREYPRREVPGVNPS